MEDDFPFEQEQFVELDKPKRSVGFVELIFISFFCVSGGCYGLEDVIRGGYPLFSLLGLLVIPWFWSLPAALMTAELSTAMPENGGFVLWVQRAFGTFWGFQTGYWSWLNGISDNALYPVMFADYLSSLVPINQFEKAIICFCVVIFVTTLNILGIDVVGKISTIFALFVMSPFIIFAIWGLPELNPSNLDDVPSPLSSGNWNLYLSIILWNTSGWDSAGSVAGEIKNPQRTYPKALVIAVFLVILTYVWPLAVAVSVDNNYELYEEGYWPDILGTLGGRFLKIYTILGALISSLGLFNVILCTQSRVLYYMASDDYLAWPLLGKLHSRFNTPWLAIILNAVATTLFTFLPFQDLIELDVVWYSLSLIIEFIALARLRKTQPNMERPFKIPFGTVGVTLFVIPPILLCIFSLIFTSMKTKIIGFVSVVLGFLISFGLEWWKKKVHRTTVSQKYLELSHIFNQNQYNMDESSSEEDEGELPVLGKKEMQQHSPVTNIEEVQFS